jgi:hypothetical protein
MRRSKLGLQNSGTMTIRKFDRQEPEWNELAIRDSYTHEDFVINIEKGDFE